MATKKEIELFQAYVLNYRSYLEDDIAVLQNNLRYRKVDVVDCLELSLAIERLNQFNEFVNHMRGIFKIDV